MERAAVAEKKKTKGASLSDHSTSVKTASHSICQVACLFHAWDHGVFIPLLFLLSC